MKVELVTTLKRETTRKHIVEGIARGEAAIREKRTFTQAEAKEKMSKWLR
jgi:hypothetical protein